MDLDPSPRCPWCNFLMYNPNYICDECNRVTPLHHIILYLDESVICRNSTTCQNNHVNNGPQEQVEHVFDDIVQPVAEPVSTNPALISAEPTPDEIIPVVNHHLYWAGVRTGIKRSNQQPSLPSPQIKKLAKVDVVVKLYMSPTHSCHYPHY